MNKSIYQVSISTIWEFSSYRISYSKTESEYMPQIYVISGLVNANITKSP